MTYTLTNSQSVIRDADGACIPFDPANTDYQTYLKWMEDGNEPNPYVAPPPPVPSQAPMWAVRVVLKNHDLFDQAEQAITASGDVSLQTVWEYGNFAVRSSAAIATLAAALNLTDEQIDAFFFEADALVV